MDSCICSEGIRFLETRSREPRRGRARFQQQRRQRSDRRPDRHLRRLRGALSDKLPLFLGVVVLLSFLLLTAVFRSLLIPALAALMNLLTAGASFGVITAVPSGGWAATLLGTGLIGDVRHGSMKRVAAAVGEGASAVRSVHTAIASALDPGRVALPPDITSLFVATLLSIATIEG
jgi:hypothetical protein